MIVICMVYYWRWLYVTGCYLSLNESSKQAVLDFSEKYLDDRCIDHYTEKTEDRDCIRLYWKRNTLLPFRHVDIYDENKEKELHPNGYIYLLRNLNISLKV